MDSLQRQFEMLRVQLETGFSLPYVFAVSCARKDDGKDVVVTELARSMAAANYRTLVISADREKLYKADVREPKSLSDVVALGLAPFLEELSDGLHMLHLAGACAKGTASRDIVGRFVDLCQAMYQVTIIDLPRELEGSFALLAATIATGVIVSTREGRRVCGQDRILTKALTREDISFLGVVSVPGSVINTQTSATVPSRRVIQPRISSITGDVLPSRAEQKA